MNTIIKLSILFTLFLNTSLFSQEIKNNDVFFSIQEIPKQSVAAFYSGRSFTQDQIQQYTNTCVYTTIFKNISSDNQIHYLRKNWFASSANIKYSIKTNEYWKNIFDAKKVSMSSWIGFKFAQMPENQTYEANGDWNQGMLSVSVPKGNKFDLTIIWDIKGKQNELTIKNIKCSK